MGALCLLVRVGLELRIGYASRRHGCGLARHAKSALLPLHSKLRRCITRAGRLDSYIKAEIYRLDNILLGRQLLFLYRISKDARYLKAATILYDQLQHQPRTPSDGFWHKQRYPNQMWFDGLYMAEPFYAEYASISHHLEDFSDITHQFVLMEAHARDPKTGLLYHGWDESEKERWANKTTGDSPEFWARGMGWFMMALVDSLDYYPQGNPGRALLIAILTREAAAVAQYQDPSTGLWYQVIDKAGKEGNYLESSAACMFVYALAKAVHRGYLPDSILITPSVAIAASSRNL